jgi:hypothetical protein
MSPHNGGGAGVPVGALPITRLVGGQDNPYATYLVYDTFTDANATALASHTPNKDNVGSGWTDVTAGITIESNKASDNQGDRKSVIDAGEADVTIEATVTLNAKYGGFLFRYQDSTHYHVAGCNTVSNETAIWENNGGVWTKIGSNADTYSQGDVLALKLILSGQSIKFYVNDVLKVNITEASFETETEHGLYMDIDSAGADTLWDDFSII